MVELPSRASRRSPIKSRILAVVVGLSLAFAANAQTLTKAEEGRKEVGKCYRSCMADDGGGGRLSAIAWLDQYWANWRDSGKWTDEQWTSFLTEWKRIGCIIAQGELLEAYGCRYACFDVEQAYGVTSSSARSVFLRAYNSSIAQLKQSGLWVTNDRDYPRPGTDAFNTACENYFDPSGASEGADAHLDVARELLQRGPRPVE